MSKAKTKKATGRSAEFIVRFRAECEKRILVLDGAMGTAIQALNLTADDYGGLETEGCPEFLCVQSPRFIETIHREHLIAGADIIETNSFGGAPFVLGEFGLEARAHEINLAAAKLARSVANEFSSKQKPRFVAGCMGPTTKAISVTGGMDFDGLSQQFYLQAKALWEGGVDFLLLETSQDTRNIKSALVAIDRLELEINDFIPVAVSGTIEPMGTMLAGQGVEALAASLWHRDLLYLGLNCATGPEFMTEHLRALSGLCPFPIACVPNAGLPDEEGNYLETPKMMSESFKSFIDQGWLNLIGGCCGTLPAHTQAFAEIAAKGTPRSVKPVRISVLSGVEFFEVNEDVRPVIVGERTNVIGSRKFKKLICDEAYEAAAEIGRKQVRNGAQILDVCLANPDRNELQDTERFLECLNRMVKVPLMIDSTDPEVIEAALKLCQGKCLINSINLEDGEERFASVVPLALRYGAALVVGTIDDDPQQGMGVTCSRKLEIAARSFELLNQKYSVPAEDIYWDPLVFPCGTGDENYLGSAAETIAAIRMLKERFPGTRTVLGISNVSFGLPSAGREVLNSVFLYHCIQSGLDLALVNSEKIKRFASLSKADRKISENLLYNEGKDPIAAFAERFRDMKPVKVEAKKRLPLDDRLANYVLEGTKEGLVEDLKLKLKESKPLEIINGPLMAGMDEVGRLFNENKLIVAEVLQSAEAMKAAVAYLEPLMNKEDSASRGKVVLATVKGDVHDIGKNLVEIILSNNGFEVVNLGIKVASDKLIEAIETHQPDIIGLSGLLVKSAQQMVATAEDFSKAGIQTPIMVGGAALSPNFVDRKIAKAYTTGTVTYAADAMKGLDLAKTIVNPAQFASLKKTLEARRSDLDSKQKNLTLAKKATDLENRSPEVPELKAVPSPGDWGRHVLISKTPIEQIWKFINPMMMYGRHLGVKGGTVRKLTASSETPSLREEIRRDDPKVYALFEKVEEVKSQYGHQKEMVPKAVYGFFRARSEGNSIHIYDQDGGSVLQTFKFPRQDKRPFYCIADFVSTDLELQDSVGLFAVTVGEGVRETAEKLKEDGDYLKSHILQVLALESAEAYAEFIHSQMRRSWGMPDSPQMTMLERFQAKYQGKRYSFGYPACPQLADQRRLFDVLRPEDIGIELTDGFMMDPEASVSGMVFHHPQAAYFSVGRIEEDE